MYIYLKWFKNLMLS